jgi:hypothetical protein
LAGLGEVGPKGLLQKDVTQKRPSSLRQHHCTLAQDTLRIRNWIKKTHKLARGQDYPLLSEAHITSWFRLICPGLLLLRITMPVTGQLGTEALETPFSIGSFLLPQ